MIEQLKVCQHNAARSSEIQQSLFEIALKEEACIIFVQEPYTFRDFSTQLYFPVSHPSFRTILPYNNMSVRPRVITYLNKNFPFEVSARTDLISDPDLQLLEFDISSETFYILNIYNERPTITSEKRTTIQRFFDYRLVFDKPFLFLGDFNLHHPDWNPTISNPSPTAIKLADFIEKYQGIPLMNSGVIHEFGGTFHRPNTLTTSIIDLAFAFGFKRIKWKDWHYIESTGSDHECIILKAILPNDQPHPKSILPKFNLCKADWVKFKHQLQGSEQQLMPHLENLIRNKDYDSMAQVLQEAISQAAVASIPISRPSSKSKAWWTPELTDMRKTYHTLHRKALKSQTIEDFGDSRAARNRYFRSIKNSKKAHWQQFLNEASDKTIFTAFNYSDPKKQQTATIPALRFRRSPESDEEIATTFPDKCTAFISNLFSLPDTMQKDNNSTPVPTDLKEELMVESSTPHKWEWPELRINELLRAIPSKNTAPGADQIAWPMIKKAIEAVPSLFMKVYYILFHHGHHPTIWKDAIGIIIPKRNKKDYSTPKAYRPISLLPCLSKLLEKLFANRLAHYAHVSDTLLHPSQMGARKQRSATDAALLLQSFIERNLARNKTVSTILLDVMGAFDRLQPNKLVQVLRILHLPTPVISWVASFLSNRSIRLLFNSQLSSSFPVIGTPQGSPISPILFLISIRFLFASHMSNNFTQISYMDDITVSVASFSVKNNINELEKQLRDLAERARYFEIVFETEKSELIHFHRGRAPIMAAVNFKGAIIQPKSLVRWLGFWFDSKLSFQTHIEKRLQLANGAIQRLKSLASASKGLRLNGLRQLYLACVTSIMDYGSILWFEKYGTAGKSTKCQGLQNRALRLITGAFNNSPIKALEVEAAIMPTRVRHFKAALNYALRLLRLQITHPVQDLLFTPLQDELALPTPARDFGLLAHLTDKKLQLHKLAHLLSVLPDKGRIERLNARWLPPWLEHKIEISISALEKEEEKINHEKFIDNISWSSTIIYTDGSHTPGKGCGIGIAIYLPYTREVKTYSYNIGDDIGIADTETFCILKAIKILTQKSIPGKYYIFSDSQSALKRVNSGTNYISHQIRSAAKSSNIFLGWCPGHVGIKGNELADQLARAAFKKPISTKDKFLSHSLLKEKARHLILHAWNNDWIKEVIREEEGRLARGLGKYYRIQARRQIPHIKLKPFNFGRFSRKTQSAYIQVRTGIGNTRAYLYKIGKVTSPTCNFCQIGKQTMGHLLLQCPKYNSERYQILGDQKTRNLPFLFNTSIGKQRLLQYLELTSCISTPKMD